MAQARRPFRPTWRSVAAKFRPLAHGSHMPGHMQLQHHHQQQQHQHHQQQQLQDIKPPMHPGMFQQYSWYQTTDNNMNQGLLT